MSREAVVFAFVLCGAGAARAEPVPPNVQPGLWQFTTVVHMQGLPTHPEALAAMPPDMRARVQAMIGRQGQPHVRQVCLTPEKLRHGFEFGEHHPGNCSREMRTPAPGHFEVSAVCGEPDNATRMHAVMDAPNPRSVTGHYEVDREGGAGPIHITGDVTGLFLAPTCTPEAGER